MQNSLLEKPDVSDFWNADILCSIDRENGINIMPLMIQLEGFIVHKT